MAQKQYLSSLSRQLSGDKPNTKLVLLCLEFNKPNKQNVYYINLCIKKMKHQISALLKPVNITTWTCCLTRMFQSVSRHGQLYRIYKVSPILCQTLIWESPTTEDTNFHRDWTLLSFKSRIEWLSVLSATASFPYVYFQLLQFLRQHLSFSARRAAWWQKLPWFFKHFL